MLVQVNRTLKRNKALDTGRVQGRIVAALDGIEVLSSYSRCCDSCLWITTLDAQAFPATLVRRLGHDRWKQENNGWNDLTQNWAFKHGFLHACRHRPQTHNAEGERKPAANRGLAAVSIILLLAFPLCSAFIHCYSKIFRRYPTSTIKVAHQLRSSQSKLPPNIRAPDSPAAIHSA